MSLLPIEEALARIFARIPAPIVESVPLASANNRVLVSPLIAAHNQPPFNASAMDGYAVRAADVVPNQPLKLVGTSQAGQRFVGLMAPGQCVRIFTGAPLPIGADAVIMQEEATANGNGIAFQQTPPVGRSIRPIGNDFQRGQELLPSGIRLTPAKLALAAAANQAELSVAKRLRIAVLATGDELVLPGTALGADQIVASNNYGLVPMLSAYAERVDDLGVVSDDKTNIEAALLGALDSGVDVIVTTGGASVGDRDHMRDVLIDLGVTLDFWKINMRPGKPLMFGVRGKTLIFGLPGNPVSALVTATLFIKPALRKWLGLAEPLGERLRLPLAAPTPPNTARRHFMRGVLSTIDYGATAVLPISETDSGHTSSLAQAEVLIMQPENDAGQPAGALVDVIRLDEF